MDTNELTYRIAFASIRGMGYDLAKKILDIIPSERDFFTLSQRELQSTLSLKNKITESGYRHQLLEKAEHEVEFVTKNKIGVKYFTDDDYPERLIDVNDAPILIYMEGKCNLNAKKIISMVGTRNATIYGQHFCDKFIADIAAMVDDAVIVSGLAYGIDIASHRAAVANGLPTVAVLAHGLNTIYPSQHRNDAIDIIRHGGALLTDYTSQDVLHRGNFIARNRIVAAISDCTLVVESAIKGGALITARLASSYNRDVFAVPGRISDDFSAGCNKLIRDNEASLITCADDLIKAMRWEKKANSEAAKQKSLFPELTTEETTIVEYLKKNPDAHINAISAALEQPMSQLLSTLVDLEFKGVIMVAPGNKYSLA